MLKTMIAYWWVILLRGLISLAFALLAFTRPEFTFVAMVVTIGLFFFTDGLLAVVLGWRLRGEDDEWWTVLLEGLLGVGIGVAAMLRPDIGAGALVTLIAVWCLLSGVFELFGAIKLRKEIDNEWMLALAGIVSIGLGVLMLVNPTAGAISLMWWVGIYAALFGAFLVFLAFRLRKAGKKLKGAVDTLRARLNDQG
jgi:uncharacterized membrane protein HdeD (DUF308 family)